MPLPRFEYLAPQTVEEACKLLAESGDGVQVMAGGTDLLLRMRGGLLQSETIIGLKSVAGLDRISFEPKQGLTIGATALIADVAAHPAVIEHYPAIAHAAMQTATVQIRNMATVIGNVCNGSPCGDNIPTLIAMQAEATLASPGGERKLPLEAFFKGPGIVDLGRGEIVTAIRVPPLARGSGASYRNISARSRVDITAVGVGTVVTLDGETWTCTWARIVLGGVAPVPMRAVAAEALCVGKPLTEELIAEAASEAAKEAKPISDIRASADYRRRMVGVLSKRTLTEARERARAR